MDKYPSLKYFHLLKVLLKTSTGSQMPVGRGYCIRRPHRSVRWLRALAKS